MALPTTDLEVCNLALDAIGTTSITSLTDTNSKEARTCNRNYDSVLRSTLESYSWDFALAYAKLTLSPKYTEYNEEYLTSPVAISGITQANPCVITTVTGHGAATGDHIHLSSISGMTELNEGIFKVTVVDTTTLQLTGINTTNFTAYVSGGEVVLRSPLTIYSEGYAYALPSDFILSIGLEEKSQEYTIKDSKLFTTVENAVLRYIKSGTSISDYRALFIRVVVLRLAIAICNKLIKNTNASIRKIAQLYEELNRAEEEAKFSSSQNTSGFTENQGSWLNVRAY